MLKKILKKYNRQLEKFTEKFLPFLMLLFIINFSLPHLAVAKSLEPIEQLPLTAGRLEFLRAPKEIYNFPEIKLRSPQYRYKIWVTAYNSHQTQTDSSPCITASGFNLCQHNQEDVVAINFLNLPFGTKVRFPELFGNKIFVVEDRMSSRYWQTADIWLKDYVSAKKFGRKWTTIEILPFVR